MKIFLIAAAAVVVLLIVGMLISGGQHGPGRHLSLASVVALVATVALEVRR